MIQTDPVMARKARWASLVGTSLESYDFYIYAYFAAFFVGPLFFDPLGGFGGTLAAFLSIALAFIIRPVGAILFGHIGDRIGRRKTLIATVTLMGVATGLIGVLPTYEQAGWFGAAVLVLCDSFRESPWVESGAGQSSSPPSTSREPNEPLLRRCRSWVPDWLHPLGQHLSG
jgi:MFS family permease